MLCVAAGVFGSLLGAHALAKHDAAKVRQPSRSSLATAAAIAATVDQSLQHGEDLTTAASTYFAAKPGTTPREFKSWANWVHALARFPQVERLSFVRVFRSNELAQYQALISGHPLKTAPPASGKTTASAQPKPITAAQAHVSPAGKRSYYCLTVAEVTRAPAHGIPAGRDYCSRSHALLLARDSGLPSYGKTTVHGVAALRFQTPVYKGNSAPTTEGGRIDTFAGWLRETLVPSAILSRALGAHGGGGAKLELHSGEKTFTFSAGTIEEGAQPRTTALHGGWSVTSFPPPVSTSILKDPGALALLIAGCLLSVALGMLVLLLTGNARVPAPTRAQREAVPAIDQKPQPEELYDPLTGLPTRALTFDRADRMLARAGRESGLLVGALFVDLDHFKDVNEKLGRDAGDQLLRIVAERLQTVVRTHDTVGRLEGDKFLIVCEAAARSARLDSLARRVIEALHKPVELPDFGPSFFTTASIGLAFGRYEDPEELVRDAQLALQASKGAGRDRYTIFNANMRSVIEDRGVLEAELNAALLERQFFLLYQPVLDLATHKVVGLEALIRWMHPKRGVLAPADFIPVAEETGLIVPIGRWALEEASTKAAAWDVAGHPLEVAVQVSGAQLNRDGFGTDVLRALQQSGIRPGLLTLEIAESTIMQDLADATRRLDELKQLGVRLAIDEFGNGYAYRSDLEKMPLDYLKVDRSSLAASDDEDYRSWLLEAILVFGRDLSLTVVAKGVETHEQLTSLKDMGCPLAQGFYLGKPLPPEAVEDLFRSQQTTTVGAPATAAQPAPAAAVAPQTAAATAVAPAPVQAPAQAPGAAPAGDAPNPEQS
jgi:diguanylate cyclase (GGDEF)-like protein